MRVVIVVAPCAGSLLMSAGPRAGATITLSFEYGPSGESWSRAEVLAIDAELVGSTEGLGAKPWAAALGALAWQRPRAGTCSA